MLPIEPDEDRPGGAPSCSGHPITNTTCVIVASSMAPGSTSDLATLIRNNAPRWLRVTNDVFVVEGRYTAAGWAALIEAVPSLSSRRDPNVLVLEGKFSGWAGWLPAESWDWIRNVAVAGGTP